MTNIKEPVNTTMSTKYFRELQRLAKIGRQHDIKLLIYVYNSGYHAGHHDTVEGDYVDIHHCDMDSYNEDEVKELVTDILELRE